MGGWASQASVAVVGPANLIINPKSEYSETWVSRVGDMTRMGVCEPRCEGCMRHDSRVLTTHVLISPLPPHRLGPGISTCRILNAEFIHLLKHPHLVFTGDVYLRRQMFLSSCTLGTYSKNGASGTDPRWDEREASIR